MGLFSKANAVETKSSVLPSDLVARLEPFGRFEFDPQGSGVDPIGLPTAEYPLLQKAKADPDAFIGALASATVPKGGWTVYGAMRLISQFGLTDPEVPHGDADAIRLAALQFIHESGYGSERLRLEEQMFWNRTAGEAW